MKKVTLFKVTGQDILVDDFAKFIQYHQRPTIEDFYKVGDKAVITDSATIHELPIYQWGQIQFGKEIGGFIAMEPKLREILESPFDHALREVITTKQMYHAELKQLNERVRYFNSLPWYKRIFKRV